MESILRYVLKSYFDEYITGLDRIDCSKIPVTLSNLRLRETKIKEEMEDSAFEFLDGMIGRVQMQMSWRGKLEVVVSDIKLNFSFHPMKAMKKVLMPQPEDAEDDDENQVPSDVQQRMAAVAPMPQQNQLPPSMAPPNQPPPGPPVPQIPPRFCAVHGSSERRAKGDPRLFECESCRTTMQTTYTEARLCPQCSDRERRCMCCGADASSLPGRMGPLPAEQPSAMPPPQPLQQAPMASAEQLGSLAHPRLPPGSATPQPAFCKAHETSEQRPKGEPQTRECRSCEVQLQTNYVHFALCPVCSQRDSRCMICGMPSEQGQQLGAQPQRGLGGGDGRAPWDGGPYGPAPDGAWEQGSRCSRHADDSWHDLGPDSHHELELPPPPPAGLGPSSDSAARARAPVPGRRGVHPPPSRGNSTSALGGLAPLEPPRPMPPPHGAGAGAAPPGRRRSGQDEEEEQWRPCSPPRAGQPSPWAMGAQHPWLANERPPSPPRPNHHLQQQQQQQQQHLQQQQQQQQQQHPWLPDPRPPSPPRMSQQTSWPVNGGARMDGLPPTWAPRRASHGAPPSERE